MHAKPVLGLMLAAGLATLTPLTSSAGEVEKSYWGRGDQYLPDGTRQNRPAAPTAVGLMVKLLQVMPDGTTRYVSTRRTFSSGDRFKVEVRPNTKGYLYVFNQEEGGTPQLIYPAKAANQHKNGQKLTLPGKGAFEFDGKPGKERLTLVLAKAPIEGGDSAKNLQLKPIREGEKGLAIEETQQGKAIVIVAPEDQYEGGRAHLVYTLELKHQ